MFKKKCISLIAMFGFCFLSLHASAKVNGSLVYMGTEAQERELPWQVALVKSEGMDSYVAKFCGAVVLNSRWIVTAAHCVDGRSKTDFKVLGGSVNIRDENMERYNVVFIIPHPSYNKISEDFDLAMVKIDRDFSALVAPIDGIKDFAETDDSLNATDILTVSGWGNVGNVGYSSESLLKASVPYMPREACNGIRNNRISNNMLCAGTTGQADACDGDSGGPLTYNENSKTLLVGLVSWGAGCGNYRLPVVYTRMPIFKSWIIEQMQ